MAKKEPTKTATVKRKWLSEFNVRYRKLKGAVNAFIIKEEVSNLTNVYEFGSDVDRLTEFMEFLERQIDVIVMGNAESYEDIWQNRYILESYSRGVKETERDIKKALPKELKREVYPADILFPQPALASGAISTTVQLPIHQKALQLIYSRDFADLEGITAQMSMQISSVISDGMGQGKGALEIAKGINNRIDKIGLTRSRLLARTESVRSYNISSVNEAKRVEEGTDLTANYEWITTLDGRERLEHQGWDGTVFTESEYLSRIGAPNCRCGKAVIFK
jgi:uncharacterized protein with gpF-like domain